MGISNAIVSCVSAFVSSSQPSVVLRVRTSEDFAVFAVGENDVHDMPLA